MFVRTAVINAKMVYAIVATKYVKFPITNVTIRNAANIIPATKNGHLKIFCSAIDIIITAIGKAKNISKVFIIFLLFFFTIFYAFCKIWLLYVTILFIFNTNQIQSIRL